MAEKEFLKSTSKKGSAKKRCGSPIYYSKTNNITSKNKLVQINLSYPDDDFSIKNETVFTPIEDILLNCNVSDDCQLSIDLDADIFQDNQIVYDEDQCEMEIEIPTSKTLEKYMERLKCNFPEDESDQIVFEGQTCFEILKEIVLINPPLNINILFNCSEKVEGGNIKRTGTPQVFVRDEKIDYFSPEMEQCECMNEEFITQNKKRDPKKKKSATKKIYIENKKSDSSESYIQSSPKSPSKTKKRKKKRKRRSNKSTRRSVTSFDSFPFIDKLNIRSTDFIKYPDSSFDCQNMNSSRTLLPEIKSSHSVLPEIKNSYENQTFWVSTEKNDDLDSPQKSPAKLKRSNTFVKLSPVRENETKINDGNLSESAKSLSDSEIHLPKICEPSKSRLK